MAFGRIFVFLFFFGGVGRIFAFFFVVPHGFGKIFAFFCFFLVSFFSTSFFLDSPYFQMRFRAPGLAA